MNELFKFHLDKVEEDALVHFLTAKAKGPGLEQLIHFFLQRGRYVEVRNLFASVSALESMNIFLGYASLRGVNFIDCSAPSNGEINLLGSLNSELQNRITFSSTPASTITAMA